MWIGRRGAVGSYIQLIFPQFPGTQPWILVVFWLCGWAAPERAVWGTLWVNKRFIFTSCSCSHPKDRHSVGPHHGDVTAWHIRHTHTHTHTRIKRHTHCLEEGKKHTRALHICVTSAVISRWKNVIFACVCVAPSHPELPVCMLPWSWETPCPGKWSEGAKGSHAAPH